MNGNSWKTNMKIAKSSGKSLEFLNNNQKVLKKYQSTSNNVIRGAWFYDFLNVLFIQLLTNEKKSFSNCALEAYNKALKKYHPWVI